MNNQFKRIPKILRSDNGGEYTGKSTQTILKKYGINFETTVPFSPEQNGIAERKNRSLTESARCMLIDVHLPKYWGEAVNTACHVQNLTLHKSTKRTPFELWYGYKPKVHYLRTFGSKVYYHIPKQKRAKWDAKAKEGILVGCYAIAYGYRILDPNTNRIIISRTIKFFEKINLSKERKVDENKLDKEEVVMEEKKETENEIVEKDCSEVESERNTEEVKECEERNNDKILRRSERDNKGIPPQRLVYIAQEDKLMEPTSWKQMMKLPEVERSKWIKAAEEEMNSLEENNTWKLTELPEEKQAVKCKGIWWRMLSPNHYQR